MYNSKINLINIKAGLINEDNTTFLKLEGETKLDNGNIGNVEVHRIDLSSFKFIRTGNTIDIQFNVQPVDGCVGNIEVIEFE